MDARTVIAPLEIFRRAENRDAETAADANTRTSITSHRGFKIRLDAAFFAWTAAIVRNRCAILNDADFQTNRLESANG